MRLFRNRLYTKLDLIFEGVCILAASQADLDNALNDLRAAFDQFLAQPAAAVDLQPQVDEVKALTDQVNSAGTQPAPAPTPATASSSGFGASHFGAGPINTVTPDQGADEPARPLSTIPVNQTGQPRPNEQGSGEAVPQPALSSVPPQ